MARAPTTTALLSRLQVFEPSRRPENFSRVALTRWGSSSVSGRLGQGHADLLELICFLGRNPVELPDGRICVTVDEYQIRKGLGRGRVGSGSQLSKLLSEIIGARLDLHPNGWSASISGKLIDEVRQSAQTVPASGRYSLARQRGGHRHLTDVVLGQVMSCLIRRDKVLLTYDPNKVINSKSGIAQALVRYCQTHRGKPTGGWWLTTVLTHIGSNNPTDWPNKCRELKASAAYLGSFDIRIENGRVLV